MPRRNCGFLQASVNLTACSAAVLCGYILPKIQAGEWKRVLFVPTGALLSQISFNEGQNVPGIAHGVVLEGKESFGE